MSVIQKLRDKWKLRQERKGVGRLQPGTAGPRIETAWGDVSEGARHRAALNMREDLGKRRAVEQLLADQLFGGDLEKGIAESKRRYPEAYRIG